jgi:DNA-damage-inducible protein J
MAKTAVIHARVEPKLKKKAESVFKRLGLTSTDAIRLFYTQVELNNGLPFEVKIPNEETLEALKEADQPHKLKSSRSFDELRKELGV